MAIAIARKVPGLLFTSNGSNGTLDYVAMKTLAETICIRHCLGGLIVCNLDISWSGNNIPGFCPTLPTEQKIIH
jgi:hypothetical protein